jgi:hypothetical protein
VDSHKDGEMAMVDKNKSLTERIEEIIGNLKNADGPDVMFMSRDYAEALCRAVNKSFVELNMRSVTDEELHQLTNIFEKDDENA